MLSPLSLNPHSLSLIINADEESIAILICALSVMTRDKFKRKGKTLFPLLLRKQSPFILLLLRIWRQAFKNGSRLHKGLREVYTTQLHICVVFFLSLLHSRHQHTVEPPHQQRQAATHSVRLRRPGNRSTNSRRKQSIKLPLA